MRKYLINSKEEYRVMNQTGVRQYVYPLDFSHNAIWDSAVSPDGKLFFALGSEIFSSDYARLCEYDYETNEVKTLFKVEDVVLPWDRAIRASKMHTSISFMDQDNLIMTTHTTDKSPCHPTWMPYQYHQHLWEGFQGSNIITYNRKTGRAENLGVPVPHESAYGSAYDPGHHALYSMGFFKGHLYRYSLEEKRVKDLGKASEGFTFRLVFGPDGNFYSCTRSGYLFKVDTEREKIVDMNFRFPHYSGTYARQFTNISVGHVGPDGRLYFAVMYDSHIYALDTASGKVESIGSHMPGGVRDFIRGENRSGIFGMDFDSKGNLWYAMTSKCDETPEPELGYPGGLFCWDVLHASEPEYVGLIGTPDRVGAWMSEVAVDKKNDVLFAVGSNHSLDGPDITAVKLDAFMPHRHELCQEPVRDGFYDHTCPRYLESANTLHKLEKISEENSPFCEMKVPAAPVRIWRALAPDDIEESCVEKLAWSAENRLWALCGKERKYVAEIVDGKLLDVVPAQEADAAVMALFGAEPVRVSEKIKLPAYPGRQFKKDYVAAEFAGGRVIVGTADAMLAIVEGERVFSLGSVADNGPVRCMSTNPDKTVLYGVAGDDEDLGTIFSYDDQNGVIRHGIVNTEMIELGDTAAISLLSACAVSPDGKYLAVGAGDRLGTVVLYEL